MGGETRAPATYLVAMPSSKPQPQDLQFRIMTGRDSFDDELAGEAAAAIGRMGRGVETHLAALREGDANGVAGPARETLVRSAADAVWRYFVQREVCGIRNQKDAIEHYGIPREVLNRVGAR
jgi:hypothetical protein